MFEVLLASFIVTAVSIGILLLFFKPKVLWWEMVGLLFVTLLSGAIFKWVATSGLTHDTEFWGTRFERVEYYEHWDEWIEQECSYDCCCDEDGMMCQTIYYDCSYRKDHPAYWRKIDHLGNSYGISQSEYNRLRLKMGNTAFTNMNRDFYQIDGDKHSTNWNKKMNDYECITSVHDYENKTQAVPNVFNYTEVDSFDIATYKLFPYPQPSNRSLYYQKHLMGIKNDFAEHKLQILNGELGNKKQVKVFIMVFKDAPINVAFLQESYWKGGNKNEVVIPINIDENGKPTWCVPFSWSEKEGFKINIRDFVLEQEKLDLVSIVDFSQKEILKGFDRKQFSDFDYLEVTLSGSQLMWSVILSIFLNLGLSIFIVLNPFEEGWKGRGRNMYRYRRYR